MKEYILENISQKIIPWLYTHGIKIVLIIVGAFIIHKFLFASIKKAIRKRADSKLSGKKDLKREKTLFKIFSTTLQTGIWIFAVLMIFQEIGIEIGPLLAATGILGLALGFGGQHLVRDLISGIFIILEDEYRVGDMVCIDGVNGVVEDMTMRITILRDLDGAVHYIPHGGIKKVSNFSKGFSRINLDLNISYDSDIEKAISVVNQVGQNLAKDDKWSPFIIKTPQFLRIDNFTGTGITLKVLGEVKPLKQWDVAGEFRKRLKIAFDKNGIKFK